MCIYPGGSHTDELECLRKHGLTGGYVTLAVGDCVDRRSQWRTTQWYGTRKEKCVREEISGQSASTQAEDRPMNYRARLEGADALAHARLALKKHKAPTLYNVLKCAPRRRRRLGACAPR